MLDDIASDVHVTLAEVNVRALPALTSSLLDNLAETRRAVGAINTQLR